MAELLITIALLSFCVAYMGTAAVRFAMLELYQEHPLLSQRLQLPTAEEVVPHGGGIAVIVTVLFGLIITSLHVSQTLMIYPVIISTMALAAIAWLQDTRQGVKPLWVGMQAIVVYGCVRFLFEGKLLFQGWLTAEQEYYIVSAIWLAFMHLFHAMDKMEGMTSSETISICCGVLVLVAALPTSFEYGFYATIIGGATIGFLCWNWHPAKIVLGYIGTAPLGFLLGWMLLALAYDGFWVAALILPGYYLVDFGLTSLRRAAQVLPQSADTLKPYVFEQALRMGKEPGEILTTITLANAALVELALLSTLEHRHPALYLGLAAATVILLLVTLVRYKSRHKLPEAGLLP